MRKKKRNPKERTEMGKGVDERKFNKFQTVDYKPLLEFMDVWTSAMQNRLASWSESQQAA